MKKKKAIVIVIVVAVILFLVQGIILCKRVSKLEQIKINDESNQYIEFLETLDYSDSNDVDKYILYALVYNFNNEYVNELSSEKIAHLVNNIFKVDLKTVDIDSNGVSPLLLNNHVSYDNEKRVYVYNYQEMSQNEISKIPIYKYKIVSIKKRISGKYVVKYKKYAIENPYDIFNYYGGLEEKEHSYDTSKIYQYLTGSGRILDIKIACSDEVLKKYGKEKGTLKVTYKVVDNNVQIIKMK